MLRTEMISFSEAYRRTLASITRLSSENAPLDQLNGRALAKEVFALVDTPSANVSLKDGYAVRSGDIAEARLDNPIQLKLLGTVAAGGDYQGEVRDGTAVRILSGAPLPKGAQAIISDEFAADDDEFVTATKHAEPGRNLLPKGTDISRGKRILSTGTVLHPTQIGLLAAAGHSEACVVRQPSIAILATGDEVVAPGMPLKKGALYASNLVTLAAWCTRYGMNTSTSIVSDNAEVIREKLLGSLADHDAVLTCGGAWKGDRDIVIRLLDQLGWKKVFHSVKMGPGKAVGLGLWEGKPVFCLPGGPPSNHMAFLQLALPGLHKMMGFKRKGLPTMYAQITKAIEGQKNWTQFVHVRLERNGTEPKVVPLRMASRLSEMALADGIVRIPEGTEYIPRGTAVEVQLPLV